MNNEQYCAYRVIVKNTLFWDWGDLYWRCTHEHTLANGSLFSLPRPRLTKPKLTFCINILQRSSILVSQVLSGHGFLELLLLLFHPEFRQLTEQAFILSCTSKSLSECEDAVETTSSNQLHQHEMDSNTCQSRQRKLSEPLSRKKSFWAPFNFRARFEARTRFRLSPNKGRRSFVPN